MDRTSDPFRAIVEQSPDAFWVIDLEGRTIYANPQLARLYGVPVDEVGDLTVFDTLDDAGGQTFRAHLADLRASRFQHEDVEVLFHRHDGTSLWVLVRESPWRDDAGHLLGVVHRISEYAERRAMYDALAHSERRLAETQRIARVGGWDWDLVTNELIGTEALAGLYGMSAEDFPSDIDSLVKLAHPDDLNELVESLTPIGRGEDTFSFVVRFHAGREEDQWMWIRARGVVSRDEDGRAHYVSGTHQDVTELMEAEAKLEDQVAQNALLRAIASAANRAGSLDEVLPQLRELLLSHDDWIRARYFRVQDGDVTVETVTAEDAAEDTADPSTAASDLELARSCATARSSVWSADGLSLASPILLHEETAAVILITSRPPLIRHEMIQESLESSAVQVARVIEREQAARILSDARDAAMDASRQKSAFLATMSHEIRTPLNGVIGLNELLLRGDLDDAQRRLASGVQVAGRALLAILNDILDFSKIEAGRIDLESLDFDVRAVLDQVDGVLGESARSKGLELILSCHRDVPRAVNGDPTRLAQVITNLVSNAVKFTPAGSVHVQVGSPSRDEAEVALAVEVIDTGIGIDADTVESLLEPFTQADSSTTRIYGGTGLGLAISAQLVEALGGHLTCTSNPEGGSTFRFTARMAPATRNAGDRHDLDDRASLERSAPTGPDSTPHPGQRILVVEDNEVNRMVALGVLESLGYEGEAVDDGAQAVERVARGGVHAILMDVQMPVLDGYAATRQIREAGHEDLPIIAMTAAAIEGERERCLAAGMDAYLTKPIDAPALAEVLRQRLAQGDPGPERRHGSVQGEPPSTPPSDPIDGLDTDRLDMLRDLDPGDTTYLDRAIANFMTKTHASMETVRTAVADLDAEGLRSAAHKLSGSASNLGVLAAAGAARDLELTALDEGDPSELVEALDRSLTDGRELLLRYQETYRGSPARRP